MKSTLLTILFTIVTLNIFAQNSGILKGNIISADGPVIQSSIKINNTKLGAVSDIDGNYQINNIPTGKYTIAISAIGYQTTKKQITITENTTTTVNIKLNKDNLGLNEVVVSATRYGTQKKDAPVVVSVLNAKLLSATQSMSLSEVLNYKPGLRLETNCQNCGFTQLRLNGLDGGYSQILINSRPLFSSLSSVYGLDQIPASMIERIEVVRSGGSALFGSNAIAGTINVITKDPVINNWEVGTNFGLIDGKKLESTVNFNSSFVSEDLSNGITFYGMVRNRAPYDANKDGFTEITKMENNTFGTKAFIKPNDRSKITLDFSAIKEFRRGGDRLDLAPHLTDITEQLDHNTFMGGITYDLYNKDYTTKYSVYASAQKGDRKSYYGGLGGSYTQQDSIIASNAYGLTDDKSFITGTQFTKYFENKDVFTGGIEYHTNKVNDKIAGYERSINQSLNTLGLYAQYEWKTTEKLTTLIGSRYDIVDVKGNYQVSNVKRIADSNKGVLSPRFTLLYNFNEDWQFRGGYARGFRAPQAFNEDMHVSSVGGEQRFVILSNNLKTEYSNAYTGSLTYSCTWGQTQVSFLTEGFYTDLSNTFTTVSTGASLPNGSILEEVINGSGAYVMGSNFEVSVAPSSKINLQAGGTLQNSRYKEEQEIYASTNPSEADITTKTFTRTPKAYGYFNTSYKTNKNLNFDFTGVVTGKMLTPKVVNQNGYINLVETPSFLELNFKTAYNFKVRNSLNLELSTGIQNMLNSFQKDFDTGAQRDSDYVYGPSRPRTFYLSLKIGSL